MAQRGADEEKKFNVERRKESLAANRADKGGWEKRVESVAAHQAFEFKAGSTKINEQGAPATGCLEVVQDLGGGQRVESGQGFQFDENFPETKEVHFEKAFQRLAFVHDRQLVFALMENPGAGHLQFVGFLIHGFQKTRPELFMYFHREPNQGVSLRIAFLRR